jgi:hypothetical protein
MGRPRVAERRDGAIDRATVMTRRSRSHPLLRPTQHGSSGSTPGRHVIVHGIRGRPASCVEVARAGSFLAMALDRKSNFPERPLPSDSTVPWGSI